MEDNGVYFSDDKKKLKSCSRWFEGGCKIPSSVREICGSAFYRCTGLTSVKVPSSVREIGDWAFCGCPGLKSIEVSKSNPIYDSREDCNAIIETKTNTLIAGCSGTKIPSSVREIGKNAFAGAGLTSIIIPSSVTRICDWAFSGCTGLKSIEIGSGVREIGEKAFEDCTGLKSIEVSKSNPIYDSREGCNAIIETKTNTLIKGCSSTKIPSSVREIGKKAFEGCTGLKSIEIGSGVIEIGEMAFYGCTGLTSVEIPSSVREIGEKAFFGCDGIKSIEVSKSNPIYDSREGCNAFIETKTNTLIKGCRSTKIPSSVTKIGDCAFARAGLTSIKIPSSVTKIGDFAFGNCSELKSIEVNKSNPIYDSREGCNAIIETKTKTLIAGCSGTKIPSSVTKIGEKAFYGCTGLTSVEIPSSVTEIGYSAFYGCTGLKSIKIPSSVTKIGEYAFAGAGLTSIIIPSSIADLPKCTFRNCINLKELNIPHSIKTIGKECMRGCSALKTLVIPEGVEEIGWSAIDDCMSLEEISLPSTIKEFYSPLYDCPRLKKVVIPQGSKGNFLRKQLLSNYQLLKREEIIQERSLMNQMINNLSSMFH